MLSEITCLYHNSSYTKEEIQKLLDPKHEYIYLAYSSGNENFIMTYEINKNAIKYYMNIKQFFIINK